jgi:hypothetical protein
MIRLGFRNFADGMEISIQETTSRSCLLVGTMCGLIVVYHNKLCEGRIRQCPAERRQIDHKWAPKVHDMAARRALSHGKRSEDPVFNITSAGTKGVPRQCHRGGIYMVGHRSRRHEAPGHPSIVFQEFIAEQCRRAVHQGVEPKCKSSPLKGTFVDPD